MKNLLKWLSGKKTYLVAASGILTAITAFANGQLSAVELAFAIFNGTGLAALRSGLSTDTKK